MITIALGPGLVILGLLVALLAIGPAAGGSLWVERTKLTASDGGDSDLFAFSLDINGNTAVVGSIGDDPAGSAYIYR